MEPLLGEIFHIPKHILDECIILLLAFRQTDENIGAVEFEFKVGQVFDAAVLGGLIDDQGQKTAADHLLNLLLQFCRVLLSTVCRIRGVFVAGFSFIFHDDIFHRDRFHGCTFFKPVRPASDPGIVFDDFITPLLSMLRCRQNRTIELKALIITAYAAPVRRCSFSMPEIDNHPVHKIFIFPILRPITDHGISLCERWFVTKFGGNFLERCINRIQERLAFLDIEVSSLLHGKCD